MNKVVPLKAEEETMALKEARGQEFLEMGKEAFYGMSDLEYGKALVKRSCRFA